MAQGQTRRTPGDNVGRSNRGVAGNQGAQPTGTLYLEDGRVLTFDSATTFRSISGALFGINESGNLQPLLELIDRDPPRRGGAVPERQTQTKSTGPDSVAVRRGMVTFAWSPRGRKSNPRGSRRVQRRNRGKGK